jgi:biotin carboxyl carrier protein
LVGTVTDARDKALSKGSGAQEGVVATPMPGLVVRVPVVEGQDVHTGQVLVVVEAMKMENEYKSPFDGRIAKVHVPAGVAVEAGTVLVTVEPA